MPEQKNQKQSQFQADSKDLIHLAVRQGIQRSIQSFCTPHNLVLCGALLFFWSSVRLYSLPIAIVESVSLVANFEGTVMLKTSFAVAELVTFAVLFASATVRKAIFERWGYLLVLGISGALAQATLFLRAQVGLSSADLPSIALCALMGVMAGGYIVYLVVLTLRLPLTAALGSLTLSFSAFYTIEWVASIIGAKSAQISLLYAAIAIIAAVYMTRRENERPQPGRLSKGGHHEPSGTSGTQDTCKTSAHCATDRRRVAFQPSAIRDLPLVPVAFSFLFACFGSVAISALTGIATGPLTLFPERSAVNFALQMALVGLVSLSIVASLQGNTSVNLPAILFLVMFSCYCVGALVIYFFSRLRYASVVLDHTFMLVLWLIVASAVCRRNISPEPCVCAVGALVVIAQCFIVSDYVFNVGIFHELAAGESIGTVLICAALASGTILSLLAAAHFLHCSFAPTASETSPLQDLVSRAMQNRGLTERELEVSQYLYRGLSVPRIAEALAVSEATVKTHASHVYRKLGVRSKQDLIAYVDSFR